MSETTSDGTASGGPRKARGALSRRAWAGRGRLVRRSPAEPPANAADQDEGVPEAGTERDGRGGGEAGRGPVPPDGNGHPNGSRRASVRAIIRLTLAGAWGDRVFGLAAEAAFWSLLSLAPLLLTLVAIFGFLTPLLGEHTVGEIEKQILENAPTLLAPETVKEGLKPLLEQVLHHGHGGAATVGLLIAVWSGSTAMATYLNAITIAYGMRDVRSMVRARLLAVVMFLGGLLTGAVPFPLLVLGPDWLAAVLPRPADGLANVLRYGYWPALLAVATCWLVGLYYFAVPASTRRRRHLPGAVLAMVIWLSGSAALQQYLAFTFAQNPVYASLSAPIATLLFFYLLALAVFFGAELNSAIDRLNPTRSTAKARRRATKLQLDRLNL